MEALLIKLLVLLLLLLLLLLLGVVVQLLEGEHSTQASLNLRFNVIWWTGEEIMGRVLKICLP